MQGTTLHVALAALLSEYSTEFRMHFNLTLT